MIHRKQAESSARNQKFFSKKKNKEKATDNQRRGRERERERERGKEKLGRKTKPNNFFETKTPFREVLEKIRGSEVMLPYVPLHAMQTSSVEN